MRRPLISLITVLAATVYGVYIMALLTGAFTDTTSGATTDSEVAGAALGVALLLPHIVLVWVGTLLNWVGYVFKVPGVTLAAAIVYSVAAFLGFVFIVFMIPIVVLSYISFAMERSRKKAAE